MSELAQPKGLHVGFVLRRRGAEVGCEVGLAFAIVPNSAASNTNALKSHGIQVSTTETEHRYCMVGENDIFLVAPNSLRPSSEY